VARCPFGGSAGGAGRTMQARGGEYRMFVALYLEKCRCAQPAVAGAIPELWPEQAELCESKSAAVNPSIQSPCFFRRLRPSLGMDRGDDRSIPIHHRSTARLQHRQPVNMPFDWLCDRAGGGGVKGTKLEWTRSRSEAALPMRSLDGAASTVYTLQALHTIPSLPHKHTRALLLTRCCRPPAPPPPNPAPPQRPAPHRAHCAVNLSSTPTMQSALVKRTLLRPCTASSSRVARRACPGSRASCVRPRAAFRERNTSNSDTASTSGSGSLSGAAPAFAASVALLLLSEGPAWADAAVGSSPFQGVTANRCAVVVVLEQLVLQEDRVLKWGGGGAGMWWC